MSCNPCCTHIAPAIVCCKKRPPHEGCTKVTPATFRCKVVPPHADCTRFTPATFCCRKRPPHSDCTKFMPAVICCKELDLVTRTCCKASNPCCKPSNPCCKPSNPCCKKRSMFSSRSEVLSDTCYPRRPLPHAGDKEYMEWRFLCANTYDRTHNFYNGYNTDCTMIRRVCYNPFAFSGRTCCDYCCG